MFSTAALPSGIDADVVPANLVACRGRPGYANADVVVAGDDVAGAWRGSADDRAGHAIQVDAVTGVARDPACRPRRAPMKLPWMVLPFEPLATAEPVAVLPEMTLPRPAVEPPIVLPMALSLMVIPAPLKIAAVPAALTPDVVVLDDSAGCTRPDLHAGAVARDHIPRRRRDHPQSSAVHSRCQRRCHRWPTGSGRSDPCR